MKQHYISDYPKRLIASDVFVDGVMTSLPPLNERTSSVSNLILLDGSFLCVEANITADTLLSYEIFGYSDAVDVLFRPVSFVADSGLGASDVIVMDSFFTYGAMTSCQYVSSDRWLYSSSDKVVVPFVPLDDGKSLYVGINIITETDATLANLGSYGIRLHTKDVASFDPLKA